MPEDRVFIMLPRLVEWWELTLGCIRGRFVPVPGTPLLTTKDIEYRLNAAKVTIAVTDEQNVEKFEAVRAECTSLRQVVVIGKTLFDWRMVRARHQSRHPELTGLVLQVSGHREVKEGRVVRVGVAVP